MAVYKDEERGTWYAKFAYKDREGKKRWTTKRGFKTPEAAKQYEISFKRISTGLSDMMFDTLLVLYKEKYYPNFSADTIRKKNKIINTFILPYFSKRKLENISVAEIGKWKKDIETKEDPIKGAPYSKRYLQSISSLLNSIFVFSTSL